MIAVLGLGVLVWMFTWGTPEPQTAAVVPAEASALDLKSRATPRFATVGSVDLHLPIDPTAITALAFHQASGKDVVPMTSLVPDVPTEAGASPDEPSERTTETATGDDVWGGACLRLWRSNRRGKPDTAADIGAQPGTDIYAPVTGTVVEVRPYLLYEKHDDIQIHIQPDGTDDIDVVLIHLTSVSVEAGDRVIGGVTRVAAIREMSALMDLQLADYTFDGGDHVHMQVNMIVEPETPPAAGGS